MPMLEVGPQRDGGISLTPAPRTVFGVEGATFGAHDGLTYGKSKECATTFDGNTAEAANGYSREGYGWSAMSWIVPDQSPASCCGPL